MIGCKRAKTVPPRLALALLFSLVAACSGSGSSGGGSAQVEDPVVAVPTETRVLVYGDSLWDHGSATTCDLCSLIPDDIVVTNYAAAATRIWSDPRCDGLDVNGDPAIPDPQCITGADRALRKPIDGDPSHDVCFSEKDGTLTCIADNPDPDVLLVQFGTNDVRTRPYDATWNTEEALYDVALDAILRARPPGMACVLVIPPPIWSEDYPLLNARLDRVASIIDEAALVHDCEIADLFSLYLDIEASEGDGATLPLYLACPAKGATTGDCVHWALPPPIEPVQEIVDAIDRAME